MPTRETKAVRSGRHIGIQPHGGFGRRMRLDADTLLGAEVVLHSEAEAVGELVCSLEQMLAGERPWHFPDG